MTTSTLSRAMKKGAITRSGVRPMLEWDAGVGWRGEASVVEMEAESVRVRLREAREAGVIRTDGS